MTGSPALAFLEEDSLDPPSHSDGGAANAILSVHELNLEAAAQRLAVKACNKPFAGYGLAALCQQYKVKPDAALRGAIRLPDPRRRHGGVSLLEHREDRALNQHLIAGLRVYVSAT